MRGKRYKGISNLIEKDKLYQAKEAISLAKRTASAGFDETVELHLRTGVAPRQADQQIRGVTVLPGGTGKKVKVAVVCEDMKSKEAEQEFQAADKDRRGKRDKVISSQNELVIVGRTNDKNSLW